MSEERILALLLAAERLGLKALKHVPYLSDVPEEYQAEIHADELAITQDLGLIRKALDEQKMAILNIAEHRGK